MRGQSATFILALLLLCAPASFAWSAPTCTTLQFIPIKPSGSSTLAACNSKVDKFKCQVAEGFSHFGKVALPDGKIAHQITRANPSTSAYRDYIGVLDSSLAIQEVCALRIEARRMSGHANPCEPNYIYIGSKTVFGMGPAYVSSERFALDSGSDRIVTTNVIMAEDAKAPYHIPLAMISKDNLIEHSYYEMVVAHELAHGIMQDLYGVDGFAKLEKRVMSRDGHFASGVTDPTLAWVEGFAEAFEAYLGEKYLSPRQQETDYLDGMMQNIHDRIGDFDDYGWKGYIFPIPGTIVRTAGTMLHIADFVSDFLKAERQQPIRDNHYVLQGNFGNISHKYGLPIATNELEAEIVLAYKTENNDSVYSKEGVAAHFVYTLLKQNLINEVFDTIVWGKPRDLWEFASELRATLTPEQFARVADAYKTTFTAEGREAVSSRLQTLLDPDNRKAVGFNPQLAEQRYTARLAKIAVPDMLPMPQDYWVEFWNTSLIHQKLYGRMDRINLSTATPGRVDSFLKTLGRSSDDRHELLKSFLTARENLIFSGKVSSVEEFAEGWRQASPKKFGAAADQLRLMRRCYLSGCLSRPLPGESEED